MDPLLIIQKCKPHPIALVANPFPSSTMIVFAEDAMYILGVSRDLIETMAGGIGSAFGEAGEMVGEFVGGKLDDWRSSRAENSEYVEFAKDVEKYVAEHKKAHRFEYADLEKFICRKNLPLVVGVGEYIGFKFQDDTFYFDVKDKNVVEPAVAIIEDLAPHAVIKRKSGPMLTRG